MPYIPTDTRSFFDQVLKDEFPENLEPGELSYVIYRLAERMWVNAQSQGEGYTALARIYGVLQLTALEFWQNIVSSYEYKKQRENGSIAPWREE